MYDERKHRESKTENEIRREREMHNHEMRVASDISPTEAEPHSISDDKVQDALRHLSNIFTHFPSWRDRL